MKKLYTLSAITTACMLAACGGGGTVQQTELANDAVATESVSALQEELQLTPMAAVTSAGIQATVRTSGGLSSFGQSPATMRARYGFGTLTTPAQQGSGQTIVIISAYNNPNAATDLNKFSQRHGLPLCNVLATPTSWDYVPSKPAPGSGCTFQVINTVGSYITNRPAGIDTTGAWTAESSMDIEWAHAMAPMANIVLVQGPNNMLSSLLGAVNVASRFADVISMSWGAPEANFARPCTSYDLTYTKGWYYDTCKLPTAQSTVILTQDLLYGPANPIDPKTGGINYTSGGIDNSFGNKNVTYIAASGDYGAVPMWPSVSNRVLAVGGTNTSTAVDVGWSGSGGGNTKYYPVPAWQTSYGYATRTVPDVAMDADSASPVSVYITPGVGMLDAACVKTNGAANCGWYGGYGTSAAAPMWAGLAAITRAVRAEQYKTQLDFTTALYSVASNPSLYPQVFGDVTTGSNGFGAKVGYDLVTGLGVPKAAGLVSVLSGM